MSTKPIAGRDRKTYEFIKAHRGDFRVQMTCQSLDLAPSGFYNWLRQPMSNRAQEDARLLRSIRASFEARNLSTTLRYSHRELAEQRPASWLDDARVHRRCANILR